MERAIAYAQADRSLIVSHLSAAEVWGLWLPTARLEHPHLSRLRPGAAPRMAGVVGHRLRLDPETDLVTLGSGPASFAVTSPVRTWTDLSAAGLGVEDLVVAGDALLRRPDGPPGGVPAGWQHPLADVASMRAAVDALQGRPARRALADAVGRVRSRSDSPRESLLRLRMVAAGLPEPLVNPEVPVLWDAYGRVLRTLPVDLYYERARLALQYEGEFHFSRADQYRRDMQRDQELRDAGVETIRVDASVFRPGEWERFVERVRRVGAERGGL